MSRLSLAFEDGVATLPEAGRIAVFGPAEGYDLSALPQERTSVIQGFKPAYDYFQALGFEVAAAAQGRFAASLVCLPREKSAARAWIAQAAQITDGPIWIDGQKTDGVESILKDMRKRAKVLGVISKAHGKFFGATGGAFADWTAQATKVDGFVTAPGVFSADGIDPASQLLADSLPDKLPKRLADLGAGWGYLSARLLAWDMVAELHLVEASHAALDCAKQNLRDPRAQFHWADAKDWDAAARLDGVVMNPPFHQGRSADPSLGRAFIASAARILAPHGKLWMVANRHLPYEAEAALHFQTVQELGGNNRFKLLYAEKPRRRAR